MPLSIFRVCWGIVTRGSRWPWGRWKSRVILFKLYRIGCWTADTRRWIIVGLTLVQRRRRWTNVKPTLIKRLVSAGRFNHLRPHATSKLPQYITVRAGVYGAVVKAACLESRKSQVRTPLWPSIFKETKCFFTAHSQWFNIVGNFRDREVACSALDHQDSNFESCVWRAVSSHLAHHPSEVLLA